MSGYIKEHMKSGKNNDSDVNAFNPNLEYVNLHPMFSAEKRRHVRSVVSYHRHRKTTGRGEDDSLNIMGITGGAEDLARLADIIGRFEEHYGNEQTRSLSSQLARISSSMNLYNNPLANKDNQNIGFNPALANIELAKKEEPPQRLKDILASVDAEKKEESAKNLKELLEEPVEKVLPEKVLPEENKKQNPPKNKKVVKYKKKKIKGRGESDSDSEPEENKGEPGENKDKPEPFEKAFTETTLNPENESSSAGRRKSKQSREIDKSIESKMLSSFIVFDDEYSDDD